MVGWPEEEGMAKGDGAAKSGHVAGVCEKNIDYRMTNWTWKAFSELSTVELYKVLRLRSEVFVVEQHCVFLDMDNKDEHCHHLMGWQGDLLAAVRKGWKFRPGIVDGKPATVPAWFEFVRGSHSPIPAAPIPPGYGAH